VQTRENSARPCAGFWKLRELLANLLPAAGIILSREKQSEEWLFLEILV
jgi:hypothetical protein